MATSLVRQSMMAVQTLLLSFCALIIGVHSGCSKLEACNIEYKMGLEAAGINGSESSAMLCAELKAFNTCLRKAPKACRGDLGFHSSTTLIDILMKRNKCSQYSWADLQKRPNSPKQKPHNLCTYHRKPQYQHCGLFGDPHLKTFTRFYETCRTLGAWPLIVNKYLAVQVTNLHVVNSSTATAITKLTVIIKQASDCALEKTYEATADSALRPYFIDGTSKTGPEGSVTLKASIHEKNEKVEIYIRYIDTTLIIRRVGEYLAFSCKMPEDIVNSGEDDGFDLCRKGCPRNELLDIESSKVHRGDWKNAYAKCTENHQNGNQYGGEEIKNTLTDYYLDWCIFDVMTSGQNVFVSAAHSAQADIIELDPLSLQHRTVPLWLKETNVDSEASTVRLTFTYIFVVAFLSTIINVFW